MSGKRKDRSKTGSDSSTSPENKRSRQALTAEYSNEQDDEVSQALSMAAELGKKLDEVLERLTKLDIIENRLNNLYTTMTNIEGSISSLDKDVAELKAKSKTTIDSVNKLEQSVDFNASDIADLKSDLLGLKFENENLKKQLLYSESYSRRENLKFIGVVENTSDSTNQNAANSSDSLQSENTKDVLFKFLEDELNITDSRKRIEFQKVHCLGKPRSSGDPRPIIARFLRYQGREEVMQKARAKLKGKGYAVFEDIPKELYELRKRQQNKLKRARQDGLKAFFSKKFPDRLYINSEFVPLGESTS